MANRAVATAAVASRGAARAAVASQGEASQCVVTEALVQTRTCWTVASRLLASSAVATAGGRRTHVLSAMPQAADAQCLLQAAKQNVAMRGAATLAVGDTRAIPPGSAWAVASARAEEPFPMAI